MLVVVSYNDSRHTNGQHQMLDNSISINNPNMTKIYYSYLIFPSCVNKINKRHFSINTYYNIPNLIIMKIVENCHMNNLEKTLNNNIRS